MGQQRASLCKDNQLFHTIITLKLTKVSHGCALMQVRNPHPQIAVCALQNICLILSAMTARTVVRLESLPSLDKW